MNFIRKYLVEIIAFSIILIGILSIANLVKFGYVTKDIIVNNKDFIDVLKNIITIFVLIIGAVVSYYRFFRGRVFSNNANIEICVSVHKINDDLLLHVIDVEFKNEGSFPIWEPTPSLVAYPHGISKLGEAISIYFWNPQEEGSTEYTHVVHPLESEQFCTFYRVQKTILALTYVVQIKSRDKVKWTRAITISNVLKSEN